jgi:hypothetical protein
MTWQNVFLCFLAGLVVGVPAGILLYGLGVRLMLTRKHWRLIDEHGESMFVDHPDPKMRTTK